MEIDEALYSAKDYDIRQALLSCYPAACDSAIKRYADSVAPFVFVNFRSPQDAEEARSRGDLFVQLPKLPGQFRVRGWFFLFYILYSDMLNDRSSPFSSASSN